jgi:hypothetical protein
LAGGSGERERAFTLTCKLVCLAKCKKQTKDFFKRPGSEKG